MSKRHSMSVFVVLILALGSGWAQAGSEQDSPQANPAQEPTATPQQPAPAFGPQNGAPSIDENPPISGLDLPNLEPHGAPLSYLQPGAHFYQSVDSNIQNSVGGSETQSVTDVVGSLELQRLWRNYDLALDYLGGVGYYNVNGVGLKQIEELGINQKINWKRGQLGIRDAFSYQPEGNFGSVYGSVATAGAALSGAGLFFGGTVLGALGEVPDLVNVSTVDLVENLTPKSAVTAAAGYGFVHFLDSTPSGSTGTTFIGSSQITGMVGYDRVLGPRTQGALVFGYQRFDFSTGLDFDSQVIQLMWGRRISGRMNFLISAGPQFIEINNAPGPVVSNPNCSLVSGTCNPPSPPCTGISVGPLPVYESCPVNDFRITAAGRANLSYRFPKFAVDVSYNHYTTSGSGFFAGAESDVARVTVTRPLKRAWSIFSDVGYTRSSRVLPANCAATTSTTSCPGVAANSYQYVFAGGGLRRSLSRTFKGFISYQYNDLAFDSSYCQNGGPCNRTSQRQLATIGIDWTPRPIRLD